MAVEDFCFTAGIIFVILYVCSLVMSATGAFWRRPAKSRIIKSRGSYETRAVHLRDYTVLRMVLLMNALLNLD